MSEENLQSVENTESAVSQERLYPENEVNKLIGRKKTEVAEKVARETEERVTRELEERYKSQTQTNSHANVVNEDAIVSKVTNALQQQYQERQRKETEARIQAEMQKDAENYITHVQKVSVPAEEDKAGFLHIPTDGRDEYADLKLMIGRLNLENTPEILEEIARKPKKLNELSSAAERGKLKIVNGMLKEISDSLTERKEALNSRPNIKSPVTSLKPSTSSSSSRPMTIKDWKNTDWSRI